MNAEFKKNKFKKRAKNIVLQERVIEWALEKAASQDRDFSYFVNSVLLLKMEEEIKSTLETS